MLRMFILANHLFIVSNKSPQKNHYTVFTHTFRIGYLHISGFFFQNKSRTTILPSLLPRILYTPREQW